MTRDQLRNEYGSDPAAIETIEKFAAAHHLVVTRNEPTSARLGIGGTVANVSDAFGVKLFDYSHPKLGDFHARTGPVMLPAEVGRCDHRRLRPQQPPRHASSAALRGKRSTRSCFALEDAAVVHPDRARRHL